MFAQFSVQLFRPRHALSLLRSFSQLFAPGLGSAGSNTPQWPCNADLVALSSRVPANKQTGADGNLRQKAFDRRALCLAIFLTLVPGSEEAANQTEASGLLSRAAE